MSEAMEYLEAILRMVETARTDKAISAQLCAAAGEKIDEAFAAVDAAAKAQKDFEKVNQEERKWTN